MGIQRFSRNPRGNNNNVDPLQLFGNLSQTSHYQVDFSSLTTFPSSKSDEKTLLEYLEERGIDKDFISRSSGLLCSEASLPATSLATGEVKDNFMGISQEFAHTRLYTDFDFTFYIDSDYKNLKFFESWIEYISSGSESVSNRVSVSPLQSNYYRRMRYPDSYKCQTITITKFERNLNSGNTLKYSFINAFPKTISAVPVSYGNSDILKVNVSFNYDRYVVNATSGFTKPVNQDKFKDPVQQSAELQQRFDAREQSLAPVQTLRDNTGNRGPNGGGGGGNGGDPESLTLDDVTKNWYDRLDADAAAQKNYGDTPGKFGAGTSGQGRPSDPEKSFTEKRPTKNPLRFLLGG